MRLYGMYSIEPVNNILRQEIVFETFCLSAALMVVRVAARYFQVNPVELDVKKVFSTSYRECFEELFENSFPFNLPSLVNAAGGMDEFCKFPAVQLPDGLSQEQFWNAMLDLFGTYNIIRGTDAPMFSSFLGLKTVEEKTLSHPDWSEEKTKLVNILYDDKNNTQIELYSQYGNIKDIRTLSFIINKQKLATRDLGDSDIEDLGRIIQKETVCRSETNLQSGITEQSCKKLA